MFEICVTISMVCLVLYAMTSTLSLSTIHGISALFRVNKWPAPPYSALNRGGTDRPYHLIWKLALVKSAA